MRRLIRTLVLAITLSGMSIAIVHPSVNAVTAADWTAGRIIDDGVFANASGMSVADIQNFLNSKVPNCDTNGTQPAAEYGRPDLTHAQYAASRGWAAPPYVCLRNYYEVPKTAPGPGVPANNYSGSIPAGAISAAQMIYNAAQQYQINPKVLLVMIQKESAGPLTTDTWPLQSQYTYAMGAYCPDSGPGGSANCDPNYAGFSIQVAESAGLLRWYLDSMTQSWWQYKKPYQTNSILWNVATTGCGASNVYIESKATAALYTYTPYQPNAAALANMYGTGDGCSAYGNRNFWRIYSDWFGSTRDDLFHATLLGQTSDPSILPGQNQTVTVRYKNSGAWAWHDSTVNWPGMPPVNLSTANQNGISVFSYNWPSSRYAATTFSKVYLADGTTLSSDQHVAEPGQIVEFQVIMTAPWAATIGSSYSEYFKPVLLNTNYDLGGAYSARIDIPAWRATYIGQSPSLTISRGAAAWAWISYRNDGSWIWHDDTVSWPGVPQVSLSTANTNGLSIFSYNWPSGTIATNTFGVVYEADGTTLSSNQHLVKPKQIVRMAFVITAPWAAETKAYQEYFKPILPGSDTDMLGGSSSTSFAITVQ
jgi:hypothetical protein